MNKSFKKVLLFVANGCLISASLAAQTTVYAPPVVPPRMYKSMIPAPREDWLSQVQDNFNKTQGKQFDLVFDGGSFMADWVGHGRGLDVWNSRYAKLNAFDFGINGDLVQNVLWRLQHGQLVGMKPKMVVLMIGLNNLQFDKPEKIAEGIKVVLAEYQKDAPNAKFLLLGSPPMGANATDPIRSKIKQLNVLIASMADGQRIAYLDIGDKLVNSDGSLRREMFAPDLIHASAALYQTWAEAMQPEIDKAFPQAVSLAN